MKEDPKRPQYLVSDERRKELETGASHLKAGMVLKEVTTLIGKPDADTVLQGKDGKFVVRVFYYYIERWELGFVNEIKGKFIRVEFDRSDQLTTVSIKK